MARHLHHELDVPVGLINSSWGGTRVEPWTPPAGFQQTAALQDIYQSVVARTPGTPVPSMSVPLRMSTSMTVGAFACRVCAETGESTLADVIGWVSENDVEVELRERGRTRTTTTDDEGRFSFVGVERGLASFVLRRRSAPDAPPIITPAIEL